MKALLPILIGGFAPAVLWGLTSVLQKLSATASVGPGRYLTIFGVMVALVGATYSLFMREGLPSGQGSAFAAAAGLAFAAGTGMLAYVLYQYDYPISRLAPVLGANAVVPVLFGLAFLGEANSVDVPRLLAGVFVTLLGILLVTSS